MKWVQSPAVALTDGCGAWSLLFILMADFYPTSGQTLALGFYTLAVFVNAPHYMATIYRADRNSEDLSRYRVVTVYFTTLLVIALITAHVFYRLIPWLFTVYITWSPWHYMGQNFGLMMMFIHRNGINVERKERNGMWAAFVASYIMTFLTFHTSAPDSHSGRHGDFPSRTVVCQLRAGPRFHTERPDLYRAHQYSSLHSRRRDLEIARCAYSSSSYFD